MNNERTVYARKLRNYLLLCVKINMAPNMATVNYAKAYLIETSTTNKVGK
jgi:hypothetical protein